jgi:WD40 repeat protein
MGIVRIWDPATGVQRSAFVGDAEAVYAAAVSPDGAWLAAAGQEGIVRIWDPATGTRQAELTGHPGRVNALAVSRSGTWLATAGEDCTVRIWDLAANTCAAVMRVERPLRCCAWSPDDRQIAAGGLAGLYRFTVHPGDQP